MIRFVHIGDQIALSGEPLDMQTFAFYDTVYERFCSFGGDQVFTSRMGFKETFELGNHDYPNIKRFLALIPDKVR